MFLDLLAVIKWNPDPEIFTVGPITVRWYGLLFAMGFLIGQFIFLRIFKAEGKPEEDVETLTIYMVLATILGARIGHCLFYDPVYYLSNPLEILMVWKGGLASHGATIGILTALFIYVNYSVKSKLLFGIVPTSITVKKQKRPGQSYLWILDRIVIIVALAGCFIRFGNLMNSEIIGIPTDVPWAFVFERLNDPQPRHPAQLYESISCLFLFFILFALWNKWKSNTPEGLLFGIFLVYCFGLRFFYEFLKEVQESFENDLPLKMGQILSIPLVLAGFYVIFRSTKQKVKA
ncbi:prolipoprotein diacylglyceryl transferase [Flexithrix dorotheae]|uniref:prolipoprotein diacylglyceryl transferase n=1 Tax=Flexithrix dorotheae TaxID=70993 RepID=UPI000381A315|nr:prolipoprotein diacylglyceryl transferase [Flexithrix dorotheae]